MLKISLIRWSAFLSWNNVNETNDSFRFTDAVGTQTDVQLTNGNYPYVKLAKVITAAYPGCVCSYNSISNKLAFQFTAQHTLSFQDGAYAVLGFAAGETPVANAANGFQFQSTAILKGRACDRILIGCEGVTPQGGGNLENVSSGILKVSNLLAAVTITASPYTYQNYVGDADAMAMLVSDRAITQLKLTLADASTGLPATFLSDSEMVLRVDCYATDESTHQNQTLSQIRDYARMSFIRDGLKSSTAPLEKIISGV
jgi:hypothetical protein